MFENDFFTSRERTQTHHTGANAEQDLPVYSPALSHQMRSTDILLKEGHKNGAPQIQRRLSWLDSFSPFTGYLSTLGGGSLLAALAGKKLFGSTVRPDLILAMTYRFAWVWLLGSLSMILWQQLSLPPRTFDRQGLRSGSPLPRAILQSFGRQGWNIWRLTAPFWYLLGGGIAALFLSLYLSHIFSLLEALWSLIHISTPIAQRFPFGHQGHISPFLSRAVGISIPAFYIIGTIYLVYGIGSRLLERASFQKIIFGVFCLSCAILMEISKRLPIHPIDFCTGF